MFVRKNKWLTRRQSSFNPVAFTASGMGRTPSSFRMRPWKQFVPKNLQPLVRVWYIDDFIPASVLASAVRADDCRLCGRQKTGAPLKGALAAGPNEYNFYIVLPEIHGQFRMR